MSDKSHIEWTDATWNIVTGCTKVSPGCANCYIERTPPFRINHRRFDAKGAIPIQFHPDRLSQPLRWKRPRRVFVNSLSDLFHEDIPFEFIDRVFAVMAVTPQHTYQILTKRPQRMLEYVADPETPRRVDFVKHVIMSGHFAEILAPERVVAVMGWPGYYITSKGRVLYDRTNAGKVEESARHEMKPQYGEQGHARVELQADGRSERPLIHRMVVCHFGRGANDSEQIRHLDGNPKNNALWNLAVGNQSENWDDSKRHGTHRRYSKLTSEQVKEIRARLAAGESAYAIAPDFDVSDTQIRNIVRGKQWKPEYAPQWPLSSVWLGVTVENQHFANERIPLLLQTPAAVRFVSAEPLLGPLDISPYLGGIVWTIAGGESGPGARPMHPEWARSVRDQCQAAGVPFFMKQICEKGRKVPMEKWPEDLQVRQYPNVERARPPEAV